MRGYRFQNKEYDINRNGEYYIYPDPGYDGITAGTINVHVPTDAQEAYDEGYADGEEAQKARLGELTATTNGHYTSPDGYGDVYVEVEAGGTYQQGYQDGEAAQKALLTSTTVTVNGHYTREDGWNEIDVEVPQHTGTTAVLVPLTADTNQTYFPAAYSADGFSEVSVHVDTQPAYDEGYSNGYNDGEQAGEAAGEQIGYGNGYADGEAAQRALLSEFTATTNGLYTSETGYSAVTVNVQGGGGSVLTSETFTNNGTYTPGTGIDGWNNITIAVPTTAGTNIQITAATEQVYQANALGRYNFNISSGDTLRRLIVYFPQTGGTHITAWYQDDYGDSASTQLFDNSGVYLSAINSMSIDDGPAISPVATYNFGDSNTHKVVYDMVWENLNLSFADSTALTRLDMSERYSTQIPYCRGCTKLYEVKMKRAESTRLDTFKDCTSLSINVSQTFPLLTFIDFSAFYNTGVYSLGELEADEIGDGAFAKCQNLQDCNLKNVRSVGYQAFWDTTFSEAYLPQVENYYVGKYCFAYNTNLQAVYLDMNGVVGHNGRIHYQAFRGCSSLNTIYVRYEIPVPTIVDDNGDPTQNPFDNIPASGTLDLMSVGQLSQAWHTWAATYLPGWTIQEAN